MGCYRGNTSRTTFILSDKQEKYIIFYSCPYLNQSDISLKLHECLKFIKTLKSVHN